jgi:hypothetical protein
MIRREAANANRAARGAALAALLAIGCVIALIAPGHAAAGKLIPAGELVFKGCISDDGTPRISGEKTCKKTGEGAFSALNTLALSPNGEDLYAGAGVDCGGNDSPWCYATAALDRFQRDPKTGELGYRSCLTAATEKQGTCPEIPHATQHAFRAPLGDVGAMAVSPDGTSMYAASPEAESPFGLCFPEDEVEDDCYGTNALAQFDRAETGAISYVGCITGDRRSGASGSGACTEIPSATDDGRASGLDHLQSIAISDDGTSLYAATDTSLARFERDPNTGALTYRGCITGDKQLGPSGSGACKEVPTATQEGTDSGLWGLGSIVLSDDGTSLYGTAYYDVVRFDRDPDTGALTYRGCVTGAQRVGPSGSGACSEIPTTTDRYGNRSGLGGPASLALSVNGKSLYVGAEWSDAIARFDRNPGSGAIAWVGCLTGEKKVGPSGSGACHSTRNNSALPPPSSMALGDGGRSLYVASGSAIARVRVKLKGGSLHYVGCLTGQKGSKHCKEIRTAANYHGSGLDEITALAATGKTLYATAHDDGDIATLAIAPQTEIRKAKTHGHGAVIGFGADSDSRYKCKLTGEEVPKRLHHWRRCGSHRRQYKGRVVYRGLRPGKKVFRVRATDRADTTDPTPAKARWQVR